LQAVTAAVRALAGRACVRACTVAASAWVGSQDVEPELLHQLVSSEYVSLCPCMRAHAAVTNTNNNDGAL